MNEALQWLGGIGIGAVFVALITGMFSKRKLSAEATKIITDAASGVVEIQKAEIARVVASNLVLTTKVEATQEEQRMQRETQRVTDEVIAIHAFWDRQAYAALKEQGIELPEPPPLHPTQTSQ